jgi:hypothetical protein
MAVDSRLRRYPPHGKAEIPETGPAIHSLWMMGDSVEFDRDVNVTNGDRWFKGDAGAGTKVCFDACSHSCARALAISSKGSDNQYPCCLDFSRSSITAMMMALMPMTGKNEMGNLPIPERLVAIALPSGVF